MDQIKSLSPARQRLAELIRKHLNSGTRPPEKFGSRASRAGWTNQAFADQLCALDAKLRVGEKAVSSWRYGTFPSDDKIDAILRAFFGDDRDASDELYKAWCKVRDEIRGVHRNGGQVDNIDFSNLSVDHSPDFISQNDAVNSDDVIMQAISPRLSKIKFTGRDLELQRLGEWLRTEKAVSAFVLLGEMGIGKTRLALELARSLLGWRVMWISESLLRVLVDQGSNHIIDLSDKNLLIIDDADEKAIYLRRLVEMLTFDVSNVRAKGGAVRFLLLSRLASLTNDWLAVVFRPKRWDDLTGSIWKHDHLMRLGPIGDRIEIKEILANARPNDDISDQADIDTLYDKIANREDSFRFLGNPLLLQVAAWSSDPSKDKRDLLGEIVDREKGIIEDHWRSSGLLPFLFPYLHKLIASISLCRQLHLDEIIEVIDEIDDLVQIRKFISRHDIVGLLRIDNAGYARAPLPSILVSYYIIKSDLDANAIIPLFKRKSFEVGGELWRIYDEFGDDDFFADRVKHWIANICDMEDVGSLPVDSFIRRAGDLTENNAQLVYKLYRSRSAYIRSGRETGESLLLREEQKPLALAKALECEARASLLLKQMDLCRAAISESITIESLLVQKGITSGIDLAQKYSLRAECLSEMGSDPAAMEDIERAIQICMHEIDAGNTFFQEGVILSEAKLYEAISPEFPIFTDWGLHLFAVYQVDDARVILLRLVALFLKIGSCPAVYTRRAAELACSLAIEKNPPALSALIDIAQSKSEIFRLAGHAETSLILSQVAARLQLSSDRLRSEAACNAIWCHQFLIRTRDSAESREEKLVRVIGHVNSFQAASVKIDSRLLKNLLMCCVFADDENVSGMKEELFDLAVQIAKSDTFDQERNSLVFSVLNRFIERLGLPLSCKLVSISHCK